MKEMFFENFHNANNDYPYFDSEMRNINYVSHFHREIEIAFIQSGSVDIVCENKHFIAFDGDICIFMPGEIHSFSSSCENHLYIIKINCVNSVEKADFSLTRLSLNPIKSGTDLNKMLKNKIETMYEEISLKKPGYAYMANSISNSIIADLLRFDVIKKIDCSENKKHLAAISVLECVNTYIEQHYSENITLSDAANHANLSKYYFSHFFKEITGSTFYKYLTAFRVEKSLSYLNSSEKKMSEIAYVCGFPNVRSFNQAFKAHFNKTPTEYKNSLKL